MTIEPGPKLVPLTWMSSPGPTELGDTPVMVGANAMISISMPAEVPPPGPGFVTVTLCLPNGYGGTSAPVKLVDDPKVVTRACGPTLILAPSTKSLPVAVMTISAWSARNCSGDTDVSTGTGFSIGNGIAPEVPPP